MDGAAGPQQPAGHQEPAGAGVRAGADPDTLGRRLLAPRSASDHLLRWGLESWAVLGILLLAFILVRYVAYQIRVMFTPVALALLLTYLLNPFVARLERRRVRRGVAVGIIFAAFVVVAGGALIVLIPVVARQLTQLFNALPGYLERATTAINTFAAKRGSSYRVRASSEELLHLARDNRAALVSLLGGVRSFVGGAVHVVVEVVIGIVLSIYILVDLPNLQQGIVGLIPPRRRPEILDLSEQVGNALGGFFRGQLLVALFVGVASAVGLALVRLPFAVLVGLIAGVFNLVPLIGPFIGAVPAVVIGLLSGHPIRALWAVLVLLGVQQLDNHLISPTVMGRTVNLNPIVVMLSLLAGSAVAGIFGMVLVIPCVAAGKIVFLHLRARHRAAPGRSAPHG